MREMRLYALVMAALMGDSEGPRAGKEAAKLRGYMCLVVQESGRGGVVPGAMERVGWILYGPNDFVVGELEETTTVTLV